MRSGKWSRRRAAARVLANSGTTSIRLPAHGINPSHNPLCPLDARVNQFVRPWASLRRPEQVIGCLHVQTRKNRCHDPDHPFAAFVHPGTIPLSPCVRQGVYCSHPETELVGCGGVLQCQPVIPAETADNAKRRRNPKSESWTRLRRGYRFTGRQIRPHQRQALKSNSQWGRKSVLDKSHQHSGAALQCGEASGC